MLRRVNVEALGLEILRQRLAAGAVIINQGKGGSRVHGSLLPGRANSPAPRNLLSLRSLYGNLLGLGPFGLGQMDHQDAVLAGCRNPAAVNRLVNAKGAVEVSDLVFVHPHLGPAVAR